MALPKKGSRKIIVDDQSFRWNQSSKANVFEVRVEAENCPSQSLLASIPNQKLKRITPKVVSMVIKQGLTSGWDPLDNSKVPFTLESSVINSLVRELEEKRPEFKVQHEILKKDGLIRVRKFKSNGYENFRIRLFIEGPVDKIHYVEYELHPSFNEPLRVSKDPTNKFSIEFWTWGEFEVLVIVHYFDGHDENISYDLRYSTELTNLESGYLDETPAMLRAQGK
jgi:hypothetical protein